MAITNEKPLTTDMPLRGKASHFPVHERAMKIRIK
jgi:hypothetical protein